MKKNFKICAIILTITLFLNFCGCNYDNSKYLSMYSQLIVDFKDTLNGVLSESFESDFNSGKFLSPDANFEYEWGNMLIDAKNGIKNPKLSNFGYILKDINSDDIPELFFVRDDYTILSVFTLIDNAPKLLGAFWSRYSCLMLDDNTIYILSSNGANDFEYTIYELTVDNELSVLKKFGMNESYYEKINNQIISITDTQFSDILELYPYVAGTDWSNNPLYSFDEKSGDGSVIDG